MQNAFFTAIDPDLGREVYVLADEMPPAVVWARFGADRGAVEVEFSEDVWVTLGASDLVVTNQSGETVQVTGFEVKPDRLRARFTLGPGLADGNYRASIPVGAVADAANNALAAAFEFDFFVLAGDINRDRAVDFNDLAILAQNYNTTGKTFAQGNLDNDPAGNVDFDDLAILAQKYNTSLPPPEPVPASKRESAAPVFSTSPPVRPPAKRAPVRKPTGRG
jgi:hypothetical protein